MTNFVPILIHENVIFPLLHSELVVNNASQIELLEYSYSQSKPFGIGFYLNKQVSDLGVLAHCTAIKKNEKNVAIAQIQTSQIIHILERIHQIPNKNYSGAIVSYPFNRFTTNKNILMEILNFLDKDKQLFLDKEPLQKMSSYQLASKIILKNDEKYELLTITNEVQRLEYIRRYLQKTTVTKNFKGFSLS